MAVSLKSKTAFAFLCGLALLGLPATIAAQAAYPDTVYIPVTFYDFHSNGSNPEFEAPLGGYNAGSTTARTGMIRTTLNSTTKKPELGSAPYVNYYIKYWFTNWNGAGGGKGDNTAPQYTWTYPNGEWWNQTPTSYQIIDVGHDTSFKNLVLQDTLAFWHLGNGLYRFESTSFFPLDGRGFGNEGNNHNFAFTMELHHQFTYQSGLTFNFEGDDDVWAFINNKLMMDLGGIHSPVAGSFNVDNTGGLVAGQKYDFDFYYCERHTNGSDIRITTNIIAKPLIAELNINANPPTASIQAGQTVTYTATVKDDTGATRPDLANLVQWALNSNGGSPNLSAATGSTTIFTGTHAYDTVYVIASLEDPNKAGRILYDTASVIVLPGPAYRVYIEIDSTPYTRLWAPAQLTSIDISSTADSGYGYAVLRDRYDNLIGLDNAASWRSVNSSVADMNGWPSKAWLGVAIRRSAGSTQGIVTHPTVPSVIPDTVTINILDWYPLRLRFVKPGTDSVILGVNINTDQSMAFEVQGEQSNSPGKWTVISAKWELRPDGGMTLTANPPVPGDLATTWTYNPVTPGTGRLIATFPQDARTQEANIPVTVTVAPPSVVDLLIVTPIDQRIAGQPIKAKLTIQNTDGLIPGKYCLSGVITDDLVGSQYTGQDPKVIITYPNGTKDTVTLGQNIDSICFLNGVDTVDLVLYYAPANKAPHTITATLNGHSDSDQLVLLPGPLARLSIEYTDGRPVEDTVTIAHPDGSVVIYSRGYDQWNNPRGEEPANWTTGGNLHTISNGTNIARVYYAANPATQNEEGPIVATALSNSAKTDQVYMKVIGPKIPLAQAITRDRDGDGYLDAIELHFLRSVSLNPSDTGFIAITQVLGATELTFTETGFMGRGGSMTDSVFILTLREDSSKLGADGKPLLQTGWQPYISITGPGMEDMGIAEIPPRTQKCVDGAGPVIVRAYVVIHMTNEPDAADKVIVVFSEPIQHPAGGAINPGDLPELLFNVFTKNTISGTYDPLTQSLFNDVSVTEGKPDSVVFYMTNNQSLTSGHFMNLDSVSLYVADKSPARNQPNMENRYVRVEIINPNKPVAVPFPNPSMPTFDRTGPGDFYIKHEPLARQWVLEDGAGTVITFDINVPPAGSDIKLKAFVKIYDAAGNMVQQQESPDMINTISDIRNLAIRPPNYKVDIYWNGSNTFGMPVAPGIYRAVVYLEYVNTSDPSYQDARLVANVGIGK